MYFIRFFSRRLTLSVFYWVTLSLNATDLIISQQAAYELGREYLDLCLKKNPDLLLDAFRESDSIVFDYGQHGWFSPTTLRYVKVACDLRKQFKDLNKMHIVEIGGGYGQCKILADLVGFASYTIIDLPENLALTKKHVSLLGIQNVHFIENKNLLQVGSYDLVISNYAFSELDYTEQQQYLDHVIIPTKNGYMTGALLIDELVRSLHLKNRKGKIKKEYPSTHPDNLIIAWKPSDPSPPSKKRDSFFSELESENAISYSLSGGRLGDNLIAYFHAKWLAYKNNLSLLYVPFPFADQLRLSKKDRPLELSKFKNFITTTNEADIKIAPSSSLFTIPYFPENTEYVYDNKTDPSSQLDKVDPPFQVDWEDSEFHAQVVECLTLKNPIRDTPMPRNKIAVGVHVRRGGGADKPLMNLELPLKFPPDSYYIQQIERIARIFKDYSLYVYILTDDKKPMDIANKYRKAINNPRICFGYRRTKNGPSINILEDFFLIPQFDCLIIPQSNFSLVASKIAPHDIIVTPVHSVFVDGQVVIDEVESTFDSKRLPKKKLKKHRQKKNQSLFKCIIDFF